MHDSLCTYYLIEKLWADTFCYSATLGIAFQLTATDIAKSLVNLASEGLFHEDLEINLFKNKLILERLEQVKNRNKKAYYNRNPD